MAVASVTTATMQRKKFACVLLCFQVLFIILFAIFANRANPDASVTRSDATGKTVVVVDRLSLGNKYPAFQDVHLMTFVGFGLLVTFLKRYTCSGLGYNLLICALVIQWGSFVHEICIHRGAFIMDLDSIVMGDFAAVAVIVSFGAMLGKLSPFQVMMMAIFEVIIYVCNKYICELLFQAIDPGHSMFVHMFGAYFGLAVSRVLNQPHHMEHPQNSRTYTSDVFSMIGALFLWICFPSFNAAMVPSMLQETAVINTVMALAASTLTTFFMTMFMSKDEKFSMVHLQNAVIAGGVGVGTCSHLMIKPYGALLVGCFAAVVCVLGYACIGPFLARRLKLHDTRGVHNLHGMPGIMAAVVSIIAAGMANTDLYGSDLNMFVAFPAMTPGNTTTNAGVLDMVRNRRMMYGENRTPGMQAGMQAAALALTLAMALIGGALTGLLLKIPFCNHMNMEGLYDDRDYWHTTDEGMPHHTVYVPSPALLIMKEKGEGDETVELKPKMETETMMEEIKIKEVI